MNIFSIALVLLSFSQGALSVCKSPAQVIERKKGGAFSEFLNYIKTNPKKLTDHYFTEGNVQYLEDGYVADIDNDGNEEFIVTDIQGSGGYESLYIFKRRGNDFVFVEEPKPANAGEGPWYQSLYRNLAEKNSQGEVRDEFITILCGTTYLSFNSYPYVEGGRESYIWKDSKVVPACNTPWIEHERTTFQDLYRKKAYQIAEVYLNSIRKLCDGSLEPTIAAWLQSDLAITAFRRGNKKSCLSHIKAARRLRGFGKVDHKVKEALDFNQNLCSKEHH